MIKYFVNDKYKVLECMASREIDVKGSLVVKLSQQEIADILQFTKVKVNLIISELKTNGYIIQHSTHGKYSLTEKARIELAVMKNKEAVK